MIVVTLMCLSALANAHAETGVAGGLLSGLMHPLRGLDHLVAMVAVGLWGAQLRNPAIWLLPITFPVVMACGGLLGLAGVPLPGIELGIALSALALGIMVALSARPPLWVAALLVGGFAVFHGHAHGTELPASANALAYGVGFVTSTGLLHVCGIVLGVLTRWPAGAKLVRVLGGLIALLGTYFLSVLAGVSG
ncbi:urease accessory protein [Alteromonadaceae bacterium 2753L.S.0a.02]|nr:urease accessory protein [Alteromonadaceae bacterium 2753L.S.0a.02]